MTRLTTTTGTRTCDAMMPTCACQHPRDVHIPGDDGYIYECVTCECQTYREVPWQASPVDRFNDDTRKS